MGIWLFDENERQLALNVLQSILSDSPKDADGTEDYESVQITQNWHLKPINVTDLLGNKTSSPSILELLSKAKVEKEESIMKIDLESAIVDKFNHLPPSTSLNSFTNSVCQFLHANPQLLASLHRQLTQNNNKK